MRVGHSTRALLARRAARVGPLGVAAALLVALLHIIPVASAEVAAQRSPKKGDIVRVTDDQMHQLGIMKVELYPFRVQKLAIGQIAYNEDTSTAVLTPFPGRVTRLIAKVGDTVNRGDPLFEIDSPEVVQPQNDFIAALSAMNKARSQLDLAHIVEKRFKDLYEGKAAALKEWQQAQGQLVGAQNDMRSAEMSLEAARVAAGHRWLHRRRGRRPEGEGHGAARDADCRADRRHCHRPQDRSGPVCAQRYRRRALHRRRPVHHVAEGAGA